MSLIDQKIAKFKEAEDNYNVTINTRRNPRKQTKAYDRRAMVRLFIDTLEELKASA